MARPFNPQPKPPARIVLLGKEWHTLIGTKDGWRCRICGARSHWAGMSAHHLIKRSQGGDDVAENGAYLCGGGTTGCHGAIEAGDRATRIKLRIVLSLDEIAYIAGKKGKPWLDAQYPV